MSGSIDAMKSLALQKADHAAGRGLSASLSNNCIVSAANPLPCHVQKAPMALQSQAPAPSRRDRLIELGGDDLAEKLDQPPWGRSHRPLCLHVRPFMVWKQHSQSLCVLLPTIRCYFEPGLA